MGGEQSSEAPSPSRKSTNFRFLKVQYDRRYGEIKLMTDLSSKKTALTQECVSENKADLDKYVNQAKRRMDLNQAHLHPMLGFLQLYDEQLCGSLYKITYLFEYIEHDVEAEIQARRKRNRRFDERELWLVLHSVVDAAAYLQQMNISHENVKPSSILIDKTVKKNKIKLADPLLRPNGMTQYQQVYYKVDSDPCYLSPALFTSLSTVEDPINPKIAHDRFKSDVFSLGMVLLEAATMNPIDECYDHSNRKINSAYLNKLLYKVNSQYTNYFSHVLMRMLAFKEEERPDWLLLKSKLLPNVKDLQLSEFLSPNRDSIMSDPPTTSRISPKNHTLLPKESYQKHNEQRARAGSLIPKESGPSNGANGVISLEPVRKESRMESKLTTSGEYNGSLISGPEMQKRELEAALKSLNDKVSDALSRTQTVTGSKLIGENDKKTNTIQMSKEPV